MKLAHTDLNVASGFIAILRLGHLTGRPLDSKWTVESPDLTTVLNLQSCLEK